MRAAEEIREKLVLDRVIFVPAGDPPHREAVAPASIRFEMVAEAVRNHPFFEASDIEVKREGKSYTVDTLRELKRKLSDANLFFILGSDAFEGFLGWKSPEEIVSIATVVVVTRPGKPMSLSGNLKSFVWEHRSRIVFVPIVGINVSATEIRRLAGAGKSVRYLVPDGVDRTIVKTGIYAGRVKDGV
jgi:nicotinate-nucleotide adenylyltransferase